MSDAIGMKQEKNIGNAICIDVFMKHEYDMKYENELNMNMNMKGNMS